jgi:hypothetical protein
MVLVISQSDIAFCLNDAGVQMSGFTPWAVLHPRMMAVGMFPVP